MDEEHHFFTRKVSLETSWPIDPYYLNVSSLFQAVGCAISIFGMLLSVLHVDRYWLQTLGVS